MSTAAPAPEKELLRWRCPRCGNFKDLPDPPTACTGNGVTEHEPVAFKLENLASKLRSIGDELRRGVPVADWVGLRGRYARGAITCTAGLSGAGKTPLTLGECAAILTGESFLGFDAVPVGPEFKIAYLTQESEYTFLPAVSRAGITADMDDRFMVGYFHDFAMDSWPQMVADFADYLDGNGLLIVDTADDWAGITQTNDAGPVLEALRPLQVAVGSKIAVGITAHTRKDFATCRDADADATHIRGSGAYVSNATLIFTYKVAYPKQGGDPRQLMQHRSRLDYEGMDTRRYVVSDGTGLRRASSMETAMRTLSENAQRLVDYLQENEHEAPMKDVKAEFGWSTTTVDTAVNSVNCDPDYEIEITGTGHRGNPKVLHLAISPA